MSNELILIIIGIFFIVIAFASLFFKRDDKKTSLNTLVIIIGTIGVLIIIYVGFSYDSTNASGQIEKVIKRNRLKIDYPVTKIKVTSPVNGDSVDCRILTTGVYPENHTKDIWILLKPSDNKYYPQSDHTNTSYKRNGEWQVITRFGGDNGEQFKIMVYETDANTSAFFSNTITEWKSNKAYPGLLEKDIPNGATLIDEINVSLNKNCRGAHQ